ncbi:hypothetical protein GGF43_005517, partial [Coemansia sp. RSA 2618]
PGEAAKSDAAKSDPAKSEQAGTKDSPKTSRSWARPDLVPNLRRPKAPAKPRNILSRAKDSAAKSAAATAVLIPKWEAAARAGERASAEPRAAKRTVPKTLAEYMPPSTKPGGFDPHAEYNPAMPNTYQVYKQWVEEQKQRRLEGEDGREVSEDGREMSDDERETSEEERETSEDEREVGEPSACVLLTNMAAEIDEDLERETMEECEAFGSVLRCTASLVDADDPYERVHVVVEFADVGAAERARTALDWRCFDGRHISATFHHPHAT